MPKYLGKQIFAHGRSPKEDQKQSTEGEKKGKKDWTMVITMAKLHIAHASRLGQKWIMVKTIASYARKAAWAKSFFFTKADFLLFTASVRSRSLGQPLVTGVFFPYFNPSGINYFCISISFKSRHENMIGFYSRQPLQKWASPCKTSAWYWISGKNIGKSQFWVRKNLGSPGRIYIPGLGQSVH